MADYAFFYNSENGDRKYDADSFSDWLRKFFTNGVFAGDLQVTANDNMTVNVGAGYANVNGKVRVFDAAQIFTVANADATYDRVDTVVVERNDTERNIICKIVTGQKSSNPLPTAPVRENGIYQLVIAEIYVSAGATKITGQNVTDKRAYSDVCGIVAGTVQEMDFTQFAEQFNSFYAEFKQTETDDFAEWSAEQKADFIAWVDTIKDILDATAAGHLQNEIDALVLSTINVTVNNWTPDSTYEDYSFRASIPVTGVTPNYVPTVVFDVEQAMSGDYAPVAESGLGVVYIWSSTDESIVIPTIMCVKGD